MGIVGLVAAVILGFLGILAVFDSTIHDGLMRLIILLGSIVLMSIAGGVYEISRAVSKIQEKLQASDSEP